MENEKSDESLGRRLSVKEMAAFYEQMGNQSKYRSLTMKKDQPQDSQAYKNANLNVATLTAFHEALIKKGEETQRER